MLWGGEEFVYNLIPLPRERLGIGQVTPSNSYQFQSSPLAPSRGNGRPSVHPNSISPVTNHALPRHSPSFLYISLYTGFNVKFFKSTFWRAFHLFSFSSMTPAVFRGWEKFVEWIFFPLKLTVGNWPTGPCNWSVVESTLTIDSRILFRAHDWWAFWKIGETNRLSYRLLFQKFLQLSTFWLLSFFPEKVY